MENYTLLTNKLFYTTEDKDINLFNECKDYKLLPVMDYLYVNTNRKGITMFSLEDIIYHCGYNKVNKNKGRNLEQIKNIMNFLYAKGIIDIDVNNLKSSQLCKCNFNGIDKDDNGNNIKFVVLEDKDKDKILNYKKQKIDNLKLLYYFTY